MKNKYKIIIVLAVLGLIIVLGGATYAYFTANTSGNETGSTLTVQGGILEIEYANQSSIITLDNIYPRDDEWITKNFTVTGTNTIDTTMNYRVGIEALASGFADGDLTYTLTNTDQVTPTGNPITSASGEILASGTTWIDYGQFAASSRDVVHTYQLKIFYLSGENNQNNKQGESFKGKVVLVEAGIGAVPGTPQVVENNTTNVTWTTAQSPTLLYAIKSKYTVSEPLTTPGVNKSNTAEAVLASTPDDYGTSYYFRGNIQDNYVLFAEKCWKIVRITGNSSIKLFLWNNANTCTSSSNAYDSSVAFNPTTQIDENGNTVYNYATGVGFMYGHSIPTGTTDNEKYLDAQANITDSYILTKLKEWYTATFNTQALQYILADVIWCGDKSLTDGLGYGQTQSYFGARERVAITKKPSLICPTAGSDGKLSKYTASDTTKGNGALSGYKIGLLTADEVAFAGGVYNVDNSNYFLKTGGGYWTMSPFYISTSYAAVWYVTYAGSLGASHGRNGGSVRPVVALIPSATLTDTPGQDGTSTHPYVIS